MAKKQSRKTIENKKVSSTAHWVVCRGRLVPGPGRPNKVSRLFTVVAEKLPRECLAAVRKDMRDHGLPMTGIYLAHDSMGTVRYAGRGQIFPRLIARFNAQELELLYFSIYVVEDEKHEREIETLLIRATSHLLEFNDRKKRASILPGNIRDYEPGTHFYERQWKKGKQR